MKRKLTLAILAALAAPASAPAIEHAISGHVNRLIRFADDGKASEIQHLDNESSRSRIRWRANGDLGRGMRAGIYIETSVASSRSNKAPIKLDGDGDGTDLAFDIRHSALSFSGKWGQVRLGHTSQALDGVAEADLSGDGLVNWAESPEDLAGAIAWRTDDGGTITGGNCSADCTVVDARRHFDGGRIDVLRYDSPKLGPVSVSASVHNDNAFDVAGFVDTQIGGGTFAARAGYWKADQRSDYNQWAASASYLFSQGTNFTASFGGRDLKDSSDDDPINYWFKLGHKWGNNAVTVGGGITQDLMIEGADGWDIQVSFVHTIPKPGVELYAGFQHHELDLSDASKNNLSFSGTSRSTEDINIFVVGSRVKFN